MIDVFNDPIGFTAYMIGILLLTNIIIGLLKNFTDRTKEKAQSRNGIIIILIVVGLLWFLFAEHIANLFEIAAKNSIIILALFLIVLAVIIYFRGKKDE